jgi:hypothetical protein
LPIPFNLAASLLPSRLMIHVQLSTVLLRTAACHRQFAKSALTWAGHFFL